VAANIFGSHVQRWTGHGAVIMLLTAGVQAAQLAWMLQARAAYLRWRLPIVLAHRTRWLVVVLLVIVRPAAIQRVMLANNPGGLQAGGAARPFFAATLLAPLFTLLSSVTFSLPLPLQTAAVLAALAVEASGGFRQQLQILRLAGLDPLARDVCHVSHQLLLVPLTLNEGYAARLCELKGPAFTVALGTVLAAAILPLQLTYLNERACKQAWLRGLRQQQRRRQLDAGSGGGGGERQGEDEGQEEGEGEGEGEGEFKPVSHAYVTAVRCWGWAVGACAAATLWVEMMP
jgi:hypothetical protein